MEEKQQGLECKNLVFRYAETSKYRAIDGAELAIEPGKITVLSGPSGCGKSTLLYLLAGIYPQNAGIIDEGSASIGGVEMKDVPPSERARIVGMMFQNPDLQFCMDTVHAELVFCLENLGEDPQEMDGKIDEALAFCGISHLKQRTLHTLSGGEKQKVMLACVTVICPQWLLLDEPFANIDPQSAAELIEKLKRLHEERGVNIVAVDHQVAPWLSVLDEVILLGEGGRMLECGITRQTLHKFRDTFQELGIVYPGQNYREKPPAQQEKPTAVLSIRGLTAGYDGKSILNQLNAEFYRGKVHAITGASGSGKSTLFSVLCGVMPYEGSILLEGRELKSMRKKAMARKLGFVFQNPQDQFVAQSVYEEMAVSLKARYDGEALKSEIKEYLKEVGLWRHRNLSPFMLSQGQQRRLAVAALLAYDCSVLVCDEPTYAQDLHALLSVMKLLTDRVTQKDLTLIFSTHDMQLAKDYADVWYTLADGAFGREDKR